VKVCGVMANRYLEVSERVQGYGDQVPGGEGMSVGLWRPDTGR